MGYCHLTPVGVDMNNGFGPQPRDLMHLMIDQYSCLTYCDNPPPCTVPAKPVSIAGNINVLQGTTQTYSITPILGATSYQWSLPPTWTGSSTGTSISVIVGLSGTIAVKAVNSCGSSDFQQLSVNTYTNPPPPIDTTSCFPPIDTSCLVKYKWVIIDSIQQRPNDLKVVWHGKPPYGATNVNFKWCLNKVLQSWSGQTSGISRFKKGDLVEVLAYMNAEINKCKIPDKKKFIVR